MLNHEETLGVYVSAFVDELAGSGVKHAIVSPGSRSAPLALALAEHEGIKVWMHVDERSAGFFALGMAKGLRAPVALLCSSGSAAANYFPAVVEAAMARVPLVVLTADRPPELRNVGAPQAIDQIGLYGKYVKWFTDMTLPESSPQMVKYARMTAARAVAMASTGPCGPVHINFPLREPLVPVFTRSDGGTQPDVGARDDAFHVDAETVSALATGELARFSPFASRSIAIHAAMRECTTEQLAPLARALRTMPRGLIVCGPDDEPRFCEQATELARVLGYPILADPLSQLRSGRHSHTWVMDGYDSFLRNADVANRLAPDVILRFGAMPTSKALLHYIQRHPRCRHIVIDSDVGWREPTLQATDMVYAHSVRFCETLREALNLCTNDQAVDGQELEGKQFAWARAWMRANEVTQQVIDGLEYADGSLFEGEVFRQLRNGLPAESLLFVGNSMPVRDLDSFFTNNSLSVRTMANRGANGIDGVVSTALGASAVVGRTVLVIGDLSFYHDLNGLLAAKLHAIDITIVVVNNDGGGIFSFLPQSEHPTHFEGLFGTPISLEYRHVVDMYGGQFTRIGDWREFQRAVQNSFETSGLHVIEVPTNRQMNVEQHRRMWQSVAAALQTFEEARDEC